MKIKMMDASIRRVGFACICLLNILGPVWLLGQERWTVEGRVFDDETRLPVTGVNVVVRGEKTGTATDTTGYFSLAFFSLKPRIVAFSHIAYKKEARRVSPDSTRTIGFLVYLVPDTIRFKEVIVAGKRQVVPSKSAETAALYSLGGDEFERLGEEDMDKALRYMLPDVVMRPEVRMRFDAADFTLYVNGEFKESYYLDQIDPFNIRRVMVWGYLGKFKLIDAFPFGMPLIRGSHVILIETKER